MGTILTHLQEAIHWIAHHAFRLSPPSSEVPLLEDWSPTVPMEVLDIRVDTLSGSHPSGCTDGTLDSFLVSLSWVLYERFLTILGGSLYPLHLKIFPPVPSWLIPEPALDPQLSKEATW